MKKQLVFLFVLVALPLTLCAEKVTREQALEKATKFMSGKTFETANSSRLAKRRVSGENVPPFYVFNATEGGYVIVSGDDRTREILGYSSTGTLDLDNLPDNLQWWLDEYARQIESLGTTTVVAKTSQKASTRSAISPLIHTQWAQGEPYNFMCPDGNGRDYDESGYNTSNRCVTGCVATAMAQVLNYWQWPESCPELPAYTTSTNNYTIKALPPTTFKWGLMKNSYYYGETGDAANAVAELMRYCGQAVHMDYTPSGSGSGVTKKVMVKIFNYSPYMQHLLRDDYNIDEWESIIYQELAEGRPVLYSGVSEKGHEFIVDGYDSDGLFHINWGWGGGGNYYVLSAADPNKPGVSGGSSDSGYNYGQSALIGVEPLREGVISPYAVLNEESHTLTFYYDEHMVSRHGDCINDAFDSNSPYGSATTAVIDASFANYHPRKTAYWFQDCSSLTKITGMENLKTDKVEDMGYMFSGCSSLTSLDLSGFKTDNVTDMGDMFGGCSSLTSLDVSGFKTDNVTNMGNMFSGCSSLTSLDVSGLKTDNVTDMGGMFWNCSSLTSLDLSRFKTDNVTSMRWLFNGCSSLTSLDLSGFKTDNVDDMNRMFDCCSSLTSLDLGRFKTDNVTDMSEMFLLCSSLTSLDLSGFKTDNVTDMSSMFYGCSSLTSLDLSGFKTDNVTDMLGMFTYCPSLTSLDVSGFKTDNVTNMGSMFSGCSSLTSLDVSGFKTDNVTDMGGMFWNCSSLTSLDLSGFKTDNVTDMSAMFYGCSNLTTIHAGEGWSTAKVEFSEVMFSNCRKLIGGQGTEYNSSYTDHTYARIDGGTDVPGYFTYKAPSPYAVLIDDGLTVTFYYDYYMLRRKGVDIGFDIALGKTPYDAATTASFDDSFADYMPNSTSAWFKGCSKLKEIKGVSNLNTEYVTNMSNMFEGCSSLTNLDLGGFKTDNVMDLRSMFSDCSNLTTIYAGDGWSTGKVTSGYRMFDNCIKLIGGEGTEYDSSHTDYTYACIDDGTDSPGYFTSNKEPYAVLSDDGLTVTFYYDGEKLSRNGVGIGYDNSKWKTPYATATTAVFDDSFTDYKPYSTNAWFKGCSNLKEIKGVSNLNTDNVTDMTNMFSGCSSLTSLDVSGFQTDKLTDMSSMFDGCSSLTTLDLSGFKTDNVTDMKYMFSGCSSLTSLDVSSFKTNNVKDMKYMFYGCSKLTTIYAGDGWNAKRVTSSNNMFAYCTKLVGGQGTKYNSSYTDNTYARIDGGTEPPGYLTYKVSSGIKGITVGGTIDGNVPVYDIGGRLLVAPQKGINIIRFSNGTRKSVYVK